MDPAAIIALIPITAFFFIGLIGFSFTRLGRALAHRLEGRLDESVEDRLAALEAANEELRQALFAAHERLDFAERVLHPPSSPRITTPL